MFWIKLYLLFEVSDRLSGYVDFVLTSLFCISSEEWRIAESNAGGVYDPEASELQA